MVDNVIPFFQQPFVEVKGITTVSISPFRGARSLKALAGPNRSLKFHEPFWGEFSPFNKYNSSQSSLGGNCCNNFCL